MRPGQQNKHSRGRGNGGRKNVNPLSRSYESNGPDVKVRGNPATIAEKYVQLARDAQASGDSVMAENYFQHAEHYFRIISAAQAQSQARQEERERERAERAAQNEASDNNDENAASADAGAEAQEANADENGEAVVAANDAGETEDAPKRPRRSPRTRRPRRPKADENANATETPSDSNVDLSVAEQPKMEAAATEETPKPEGGAAPEAAE